MTMTQREAVYSATMSVFKDQDIQFESGYDVHEVMTSELRGMVHAIICESFTNKQVVFKDTPHSIFGEEAGRHRNVLSIRLQPNEGITLGVTIKEPGPGGMRLIDVPLDRGVDLMGVPDDRQVELLAAAFWGGRTEFLLNVDNLPGSQCGGSDDDRFSFLVPRYSVGRGICVAVEKIIHVQPDEILVLRRLPQRRRPPGRRRR